ncbi:hypothetical protein ACFS5L_20065 [Streptomyces phyllanthi]|uniref:Uncharacterized protein n=1 Tax=Streptomyces phyllanthi TaxID=1803180 RepID=A0A5N8W358_9ACTN|nr:hypothetical protein [Streptomyces phyllanthi]MPY41937.1 hypothetical protein [Streptomyces phyllanthi]
MGIESDQVVLEYLSRVGDLAQQRQLPSATRMRLVTELRNEIDRRRAKSPVDSPAAVRRILARLGTPDEVVAAAGSPGEASAPEEPPAAVPVQRAGEPADERPKGLRRIVPRPRPAEPEPAPAVDDGPAPPHLAGIDELGDSAVQPDWWRVEEGPLSRPRGGLDGGNFDLGDSVPGFVGGVEIPELLKPPPEKREKPGNPEKLEKPEKAQGAAQPVPAQRREGAPALEKDAAEPDAGVERGRRLGLPRLRHGGGWTNPLLLLAAALLVAGAVVGNLVPLALGWLIAYLSRRLTPGEAKWAVLGVPGTVAAAGIVWLWGRTEGRWGEPIAEGHMSDALAETWPWVLRGAAIASALFLLWRSQRPR